MTEAEIIKELRETRESQKQTTRLLEQMTSSRTAGAPRGVYAEYGQGWQSNAWPEKEVKALQTYGSPAAAELFGSRRRLSGMGPALVKMACLQNQDARSYCKSNGIVTDGYNDESFEKEFGFATLGHARTHGIRQYDPVTKRLGSERRKANLAEGAGQTGGYAVPPQFVNELLMIAAEDGFIEQRAKVLPMTTRTATWPVLDITTVQARGTTPYFGGVLAGWQPEAQLINQTAPTFREATWTAWDLMMLVVSSNQLLADNGVGLDALLTQMFGQAITWYKEYAYLQGLGAGSSMPLGVLNAPATLVQSRTTTGHFKLSDAAAMMSHLQVRSWDDACWIMHQSVLPELIQMVNNSVSSQLVWVNPYGNNPGDGGPLTTKLPKAFLNGLPIFFTEKVPTLGTKGDVMLVDWSRYVIGMRMEVQIDVSPHYLFGNNQLTWRVIARADGKPWQNSWVTDAQGWQISPFVALAA